MTFGTCSGSEKAREYWFELLIAFLAMAGMLEFVVGRDSPARAAHDAGDRRTCRDGPCTAGRDSCIRGNCPAEACRDFSQC